MVHSGVIREEVQTTSGCHEEEEPNRRRKELYIATVVDKKMAQTKRLNHSMLCYILIKNDVIYCIATN